MNAAEIQETDGGNPLAIAGLAIGLIGIGVSIWGALRTPPMPAPVPTLEIKVDSIVNGNIYGIKITSIPY